MCELDVNDEPIVLDTVTSDDTLWQSAGESIPVYINSTVTASAMQAVNPFASYGKFTSRVASYRAENKPVYVQSRMKITFDKEQVPVGYKAVLALGSETGFEDTVE